MLKGSWKSVAFLASLVLPALFLLALSLGDLFRLDWISLAGCAPLLILTLAAGRLAVPVMSLDGPDQKQKSVANTFVFLAAVIYGPAPATLFAAIDGLMRSWRAPRRRVTLFSTSTATVSTYVAVLFYELLARFFAGEAPTGSRHLVESGHLLPLLCLLALVQYALEIIAYKAFTAFLRNHHGALFARETLVRASLMQIVSASAAALFYQSWQMGDPSSLLVGCLLVALVYFLHRFNERCVAEVKRSEAEKLRHLQEIADLHMNTIESLAIAIDAKDQTTHGHVTRTQIYAMELGRLLGVSGDELQALRAGALLHDVGKLAVPEYILNKPGKLTAAEFDKMKIHTVVGGDIIKRVNFPYPVEDIVRYHHEKWDGSGYPKGLKQEQIPLVARIIAVVDFYDATRCDRPYRTGMKRDDSLALLRRMANSSFDPRVVEKFIEHIDYFDSLIAEQDIREQVASEDNPGLETARPDAGLASDILGFPDETAGHRSIVEAQREVFALHEIAQTIGTSLNLQDTVALISSKLRAIVPFDTCIIYLVGDRSGKAHAAHVAGADDELFKCRPVRIGEGITGWVIANARSMCNTPPELDLVGLPEEVAKRIRGVLVSPLIREDGAFGAITLYSQTRSSYTTEHVRLLESVAQHASVALNNAMIFERTKESALTDPLTGLSNARSFHLMLQQRIAECRRLNREPMTVVSMDLDNFKDVNDLYGHSIGDRLLASIADIVKKQLRQMDILARYAGDEFVAIMPMSSGEAAQLVAERIRVAVESHQFTIRTGRVHRIGISVGSACFPDDGETVEELLTAAGHNMQRDKHARKLAPAISDTSPAAAIDALR